MYIGNFMVTFKTAPHDVIDRLTLREDELKDFYEDLLAVDDINEAVLLQTCNRFEVYVSGKTEEIGLANGRKFLLDRFGASTAKYLVVESYLGTLDHLFRVVSSVDSQIVGENQILAQVKDSLDYAVNNNYSGRVLEPIFQKAISVGKRVRTETKISNGKVSISSAAVDLANQHNAIRGKKVLIVGTGKMASLLAEHVRSHEPEEFVGVGRTPERLQRFCELYEGRPVTIDSLSGELPEADILFSATSCPRVLITRDAIMKAAEGRERPLTLIDIAMPADIDPSVIDIPHVQYYSFDDLAELSQRNKDSRLNEVKKADTIIKEEIDRLKKKLESLHLEHFLHTINLYTEKIRNREVNKSLKMLGESDADAEEIIQALSKSLTKKIMHNFMDGIRSDPFTSREMEKFTNIFMGNGHVSGNKDEKTEE